LPPPEGCVGKHLSAAMSRCNLREYYVPCTGADGYVRALLTFCSNYDYHKSKFCNEENQKLFDSSVIGALSEAVSCMSGDGKLFSHSGMDDSKMLRDSYTGAICSYRIKRKIEVEYCSFSRSNELRYLVTDIVKYTENRIRTSLGVRSKLSIYSLPGNIKELLDAYLDRAIPLRQRASASARREEAAAYEKLYDLPQKPLSFSAAAEIEELSWNTTQRLVEAFEEETPLPDPIPIPMPVEPVKESGEADPLVSALRPYLPFLQAALEGDGNAARREAARMGKMPDLLADEINELAAEHMGDVLLEETDDGYAVIEDYTDQARALLTLADGKDGSNGT